MASHKETISILRKILYITITIFIIFGLASIGILVDAARKDRPVVLATALVLLSILLAFLVIFVVVLCIWRNANQRKRWREERDIESRVLWLPGPANSRYLPTHQELRTLRRQEKRERQDRARQRSIRNAIAAASGRISAPRDPRDGVIGRPLEREEVFVARPDPIFGHGTHGIFGARPGLGGGLNPDHGLSPPTSPRSLPTSPARVLVARNTVVPRATMVAHGKTKENGSEVSEETEGAVASVSVPTKQISRKVVGTPPRGVKGALRVVNEGVGDGDGGSGAVIGVAGEKVIGVGNERLPSQLNGHGLMAMPPPITAVQQHNPWQQGTDRSSSGRASWSRQKGSFADRRDGVEGVPWAEKSGISKNSWKAPDMFEAMTADEVQAVMKKAEGEAGQGENDRSDAVVEKAENALTRGTQGKIGNYGDVKRGAEELDQGKKTRAKREKKREQLKDGRTKAAALARSKREQAERGTKQAMDRTAEEEQRLRDQAAAQSADHEGRRRKSSETYPMPHLEAIPSRLAIRHEKKGGYGHLSAVRGPMDESTVNTTIGQGQAIATPVASSYNSCIAYKPAPAARKTNYHSPTIQDEDETEWQAQRRAQEFSRRNEEEAARLAMVQAFAPPSLPSPQPLPPSPPSQAQLPFEAQRSSPVQRWSGEGGASPTGTFSDWHTLYKKDAKDRGVRGFTCTTSTTEMERNERFESFEEVMLEREEGAKRGVANKLTIPDAVPGHVHAIDTLPSQRKLADDGTLGEAQVELARLPVRSLHSTERGTMISSFQPRSPRPTVTSAAAHAKSGIPRRAAGMAAVTGKTGTNAAATASRPMPLLGQFGYQNTRKRNVDLARSKAGKCMRRRADGKQDESKTELPREGRI